jgi:hypothetical protein
MNETESQTNSILKEASYGLTVPCSNSEKTPNEVTIWDSRKRNTYLELW